MPIARTRSMTAFVALLRAVNVGGTGKLPMSELIKLSAAAGFNRVQTYIASGNVVFASDMDEASVKHALEGKLADYADRPVGVAVRTADEMAAVLAANPFAGSRPDRTVAIFLDNPPPADALDHVRGRTSEAIALGVREIYVAYGEAMGRSRLSIPAAKAGTARNMNTVAKLGKMAAELV